MANSRSNIPFLAASDFRSSSLMDAIWANDQKLQALCGNTTINKTIAGSWTGNVNSNMLLKRNAIPDRKKRNDKITFACWRVSFIEMPINKRTSGVIMTLSLSIFVVINPGSDSKFSPSDNTTIAVTITKLTGSSTSARTRSLSFDSPRSSFEAWLLFKYHFIAIRYAMISTKILFPISANAAIAKGNSPPNSKINGKHDSPGAKDGNNKIATLCCATGTLKSDWRGSLSINKYRIKLKHHTSNGTKIIEGSNSIFSRAIKIVAGSARLKIMVLIPSFWSLFFILFRSKNPITIINNRESVFTIAEFMSRLKSLSCYKLRLVAGVQTTNEAPSMSVLPAASRKKIRENNYAICTKASSKAFISSINPILTRQ